MKFPFSSGEKTIEGIKTVCHALGFSTSIFLFLLFFCFRKRCVFGIKGKHKSKQMTFEGAEISVDKNL